MALVVRCVENTARAGLATCRRIGDAAVQSRSRALVLVCVPVVRHRSHTLDAAIPHHHDLAARLNQVRLLILVAPFVEVGILRHLHVHDEFVCGCSLLRLALPHVWLRVLVLIAEWCSSQGSHWGQTRDLTLGSAGPRASSTAVVGQIVRSGH